ncbi:hypothetical protein SAMN05421771_0422 [Granulicella pectinivorans]|uniref:Uncharacterized protein n=1 Tax=Granulicella pectinivorans TaxID=474950 RepID=A0A1I6L8P1_9BACT|nr:hypothetical protein [Granulicella pectinivorans]SFR99836.1 hypothetical protein SAMN05421771_0422 [Granulicella pectinivorans]
MTRLLAALALLLPLGLAAQNPVFVTPTKNVVAKVSIMAISTSIHQAFAGNQDTYLADVALKDGHQTARLIDRYSGNGDPIRRSILTDRKQLVMHLIRKPSCDMVSSSFFLGRTDYDVFDTASRLALSQTPDAVIPCYLVVHDHTKLAKN